jgi:hypothetical protein
VSSDLPLIPSAAKDAGLRSQLLLAFLNQEFPGVETLVNHSMRNVREGKTLDRGEGKISSISSMTFGDDEFEYLVPTIYDGKEVSGPEAIKRARKAMAKGVRFPTAPAGQHKVLDELSTQISDNLKNVNGL